MWWTKSGTEYQYKIKNLAKNSSTYFDFTVKINDYAAFNYGADDPYAKGFLDKIYSFNAPALQTSAADPKNSINDYAFISEVGITDKEQKQILDPNHAVFKGDYICIYYMGMAIVLGYNNMNGTAHEIYTPAK